MCRPIPQSFWQVQGVAWILGFLDTPSGDSKVRPRLRTIVLRRGQQTGLLTKAACLCMTHQLRMGFTFLNSWETIH